MPFVGGEPVRAVALQCASGPDAGAAACTDLPRALPTTPQRLAPLLAAGTPDKFVNDPPRTSTCFDPRPALEWPPLQAGCQDPRPRDSQTMQLALETVPSGPPRLGPESMSLVQQPVAGSTAVALAPSPMASLMATYRQLPAAALRAQLGATRMLDVTSMVTVVQRPTAAEWRSSPEMHDRMWLCVRCHVVMRKVEEPSCVACGVNLTDLECAAASSNFLTAIVAQAHRTSYGRNLRVLQDRAPVLADAAPHAVGSVGYSAWTRGQLAAFSTRREAERVEAKFSSAVCSFDAWLCLQTNAERRFYLRQHVRAFMGMDDADASVEDITSDPRNTIRPTIRGKGTSDPRNTIRYLGPV